jgi:hypothetical protein
MFRAPAETEIVCNAIQNPQLSVRATEGTSEDLTHVLSPNDEKHDSSSDKSQLEPQKQSPAREHMTSRSQREYQHNPKDSMNNHNVKKLAEIGVEGERFRTGRVMSCLGIGICLFARLRCYRLPSFLTRVYYVSRTVAMVRSGHFFPLGFSPSRRRTVRIDDLILYLVTRSA